MSHESCVLSKSLAPLETCFALCCESVSLSPVLDSLVALQSLDTASDAARKRLAELPGAEQMIATRVAEAASAVDRAKARAAENQQQRRALEKDAALVDTRLARFDDHRAAVKTNQEYKALLHEIEMAKAEKDAIEERILVLLMEADAINEELMAAEAARAEAVREGEQTRVALSAERSSLESELERLAADRSREARALDPALAAKYDQLLKQRRGLAVVPMHGDTCSACQLRLRPHVAQQVRRGDSVVQCESCQRILYVTPQL
jgi:predicted  nucleic acid-binding Zn-ribbon protein